MKKLTTTLLCAIAIFCLFAFAWTPSTSVNYDQLLDEQTKSEFLYTTSSKTLKHNIQDLYNTIYDEVDRVDVHYATGEDYNYYYTVYGSKAGKAVMKKILSSKKMVEKEFFPTRSNLGLSTTASAIPCYWKFERTGPLTFKVSCTTDKTNFPICGYSPSMGLCSPTDIDPDQLPN